MGYLQHQPASCVDLMQVQPDLNHLLLKVMLVFVSQKIECKCMQLNTVCTFVLKFYFLQRKHGYNLRGHLNFHLSTVDELSGIKYVIYQCVT